VIHHTDCGMVTFTDDVMRSLLNRSLDTARLGADGWYDVGDGPGSSEGDFTKTVRVVSNDRSAAYNVRFGAPCGLTSEVAQVR
jgi:carbonic anhydrase